MEKKNNIDLSGRNLAHVDYVSGRIQTMKAHADNVSLLSEKLCSLPELRIC